MQLWGPKSFQVVNLLLIKSFYLKNDDLWDTSQGKIQVGDWRIFSISISTLKLSVFRFKYWIKFNFRKRPWFIHWSIWTCTILYVSGSLYKDEYNLFNSKENYQKILLYFYILISLSELILLDLIEKNK